MSEQSVHEHERFAFLDEQAHDRVAKYLADHGTDLGQDNKTSHFFVLPESNLSVASTDARSVIKFKAGQIGRGIGFEELPEIELADQEQANNAVRLLQALTGHEPQVSEQFRRNYELDDIELALKYTETWGFHLELERLYSANTPDELEKAKHEADERIKRVAGSLGITLATDQELVDFNTHFKKTGEGRGEYKADEIRAMYASLYKLAATGRLPGQQRMDALTLDWIQGNKPESLNGSEALQLSGKERELLEELAMPENWFPAEGRRESLHGQLHLGRVGAYASHLARKLGRTDAEARSLFVTGLIHDISRTHDQGDPQHAQESADWFKQHADEVISHLGPVAQDIDTQLVFDAIRGHDGAFDKNSPYAWAVECIRTADALDRYRLPKKKWWINDELVTIKPSDALKARAFSTVVETEETLLQTGDVTAATARIINPGQNLK